MSLVNFFNGLNLKAEDDKASASRARGPSSLPNSCSPNIVGSKRKCELCVICIQHCTSSSSMKAEHCGHAVCNSCLRRYFESVLDDRRYSTSSFERIECPNFDCRATFLSEKVMRNIFTANQRDKWWTTATINANVQNKVVCPFTGCRAIFDADVKLRKKCTFVECYECHHGFCSACQQNWHPGVIKIVDDAEAMEETLSKAQQSHWTRCPKCGHLVEKKIGCLAMLCLCGTEFCYRCGGYSIRHICANKCNFLTAKQVEDIRSQMFVSATHGGSNKIRRTNNN